MVSSLGVFGTLFLVVTVAYFFMSSSEKRTVEIELTDVEKICKMAKEREFNTRPPFSVWQPRDEFGDWKEDD